MHYITPQNKIKNKKKGTETKKKKKKLRLFTGRFTVSVNGKLNSGVVNFFPESRLPFAQISSICQKTAAKAKAWNWYQRRLWRNETRISVWNIPSGKTGLPFKMFRCPLNNPKSRIPPGFSGNFLLMVKNLHVHGLRTCSWCFCGV